MTNELFNLIKERDRIFRLWKGPPANLKYRDLYKKLRNKLNNQIKNRKNSFYRNIFEKNKTNGAKVWENINYLLGRCKKNSIDKTIQESMGNSMSSKEIVNGFAHYFIQGVESIKHDCKYGEINGIGNATDNPKQFFYIPKASPKDILNIIKTLNSDKSPGIDGIRIRDIKLAANRISEPLTKLINITRYFSRVIKCYPVH